MRFTVVLSGALALVAGLGDAQSSWRNCTASCSSPTVSPDSTTTSSTSFDEGPLPEFVTATDLPIGTANLSQHATLSNQSVTSTHASGARRKPDRTAFTRLVIHTHVAGAIGQHTPISKAHKEIPTVPPPAPEATLTPQPEVSGPQFTQHINLPPPQPSAVAATPVPVLVPALAETSPPVAPAPIAPVASAPEAPAPAFSAPAAPAPAAPASEHPAPAPAPEAPAPAASKPTAPAIPLLGNLGLPGTFTGRLPLPALPAASAAAAPAPAGPVPVASAPAAPAAPAAAGPAPTGPAPVAPVPAASAPAAPAPAGPAPAASAPAAPAVPLLGDLGLPGSFSARLPLPTPFNPPAEAALPSPVVVTLGSSTLQLNPASDVIIGSQTLKPGGSPITVEGTPISLAPATDYLVVGGHTQPLAVPQPSAAAVQPGAPSPALTFNGAIFPANAASDIVVGSQTLQPGGAALTIQGTPVSLATGGNFVVVGTSTQALITPPAVLAGQPTEAPGSGPTEEVGGIVYGSQTLLPGSAITVSGTVVSLATDGADVVVGGSKTEALDAQTATTVDLGGLIWTAMGGGLLSTLQTARVTTGMATGTTASVGSSATTAATASTTTRTTAGATTGAGGASTNDGARALEVWAWRYIAAIIVILGAW